MSESSNPTSVPKELSAQKHEALMTFYRVLWDQMTWRRNAGYRTVILGLAYCGILLTVVAFDTRMNFGVRACLSGVIALASIFGAGYLAGNYKEYMNAASRIVLIEEYVGAFDPDYLGELGPLMPHSRKIWPAVPLSKDMVSLWSVIIFVAGSLGTSVAILLMK